MKASEQPERSDMKNRGDFPGFYLSVYQLLDQPALLQGSADKAGKQRMRIKGL